MSPRSVRPSRRVRTSMACRLPSCVVTSSTCGDSFRIARTASLPKSRSCVTEFSMMCSPLLPPLSWVVLVVVPLLALPLAIDPRVVCNRCTLPLVEPHATRVGSMATQELTQSPTPLKVALLRKQMSLSSLRKFHNFTRPSLQADATNDWSGDTDKLFTRCVCSWKCATWMPLGCQSAAGCATSCAPPPLPTRGTLSDVCNRLAAACCCPAPGAAAGRPVRKLSGSSVDSCACSMSMVLAGAALRRVVAGVVVGASSREEVATQRCIRLGAADGGIFGCCGGLSTTCTLYSGACTALNACSDGVYASTSLTIGTEWRWLVSWMRAT
mmetsp:Transcript_4856/g.17599  ORF Transcript_4856/g.17599 Transcript_4856/m.17599 type:complete len:326 (-) Transcript_4856:3622-4599(-)